MIDKALSQPIALPTAEEIEKIGDKFSDVTKMIHKMKCTRGEVLLRIGTLYRNADKRKNEELFSSKRSSISSPDPQTKRPRTYTELAEILRTMKNEVEVDAQNNSQIELLFACEGVKVYYIENRGEVTSSLEDSTLRIVRIGPDDQKHLDETIFLQIIKTSDSVHIEMAELAEISPDKSDNSENTEDFVLVEDEEKENGVERVDPSFIYPLVPGVSPCLLLRTEYGAFILPDLQSTDGGAIGLMVPPEADEIVLEIMIAFLNGVVKESGAVEFGDLARQPRSSISDAVSSNIVKGAYYISQGLVYSAEKAGQLMNYGTPYLLTMIKKAPEDTTPEVPENVNTGIKVAKTVTGAAAKGACFISGKVGQATMALGRFLAPHIQKQGSKILSSTFGYNEEIAEERMTDALKITAGAVEGFGTVYSGLETSATILGTHLSSNTVKIVEHKYGTNIAKVTENSLDTVGNLININKNFGVVTPKGFFKSAGKNAGKGILHDLKPKTYVNTEYIQAANLYPNLSQLAEKLNAKPSTSKIL